MRINHSREFACLSAIAVQTCCVVSLATSWTSASAQDVPAKAPPQRLVLPPAEAPRPANRPAPLLPGRAAPAAEAVEIIPLPAIPARNPAAADAAAERRARTAIQIRAGIAGRLAEEAIAKLPVSAAALNTSEELERLLEKATQVAAERPDLAPILWQRILDEGASTFARADVKNAVPLRRSYEIYRPLSRESVRAMVAAGAEAIRYYRLHSDGPARALMARQGAEREAALGEIVRRYFLTTIGDDAAFELGCRFLERADFTSADQLFERLALYPDSQIARDDIAVRQAVAKSHLGRAEAATQLVNALGPEFGGLKPLLLAEIGSVQPDSSSASVAALPTAPREGVFTELLEPNWEYRPQWTLKGVKAATNNQAIMSGTVNGRAMIFVRQTGGNYVQTTLEDKDIPDLAMSQLASNWKAASWRPASRPVVVDGRIYLKSESRTVCCDAGTGKVLWMGRPTRFPIDDWSRQMAQVAAHGVNVSFPTATFMSGPQPKTMTEIMLFSDRLHHGLAVSEGRVFAVEGELDTPAARRKSTEKVVERQVFGAATPRGQSRHNELACYDAITGRLIWTAGKGTALAEGTSLWSTPLVLGDVVLLATGADGQLGVAALKASDGSLLWKTTLSDLSRSAPTIPVGLTADEGGIYVASGAGVLFSIDRSGGALRWAVTYPRIRSATPTDRRIAGMEGGVGPRTQIVLEENFIAREEGSIILAASDSDHVMAFDVADGTLRWDSPLPAPVLSGPLGYVVGMRGGRIVLASSKWMWGIDARGGRMEWDLSLDSSCGRALLTADALLVPQQRTLIHVDPNSGAVLRTTAVETPDQEPVGNLLAAGEYFLVASAARIIAMKPKQPVSDPAAAPKTDASEAARP